MAASIGSSLVKCTPKLTELKRSFSFNQVMMRIQDPKLSLPFYQNYFDMKLIETRHLDDFSLYFLVTIPPGQSGPTEGRSYLKSGDYGCCLELTHNHGTEKDDTFRHHSGNSPPKGFGHIGFLVDNLDAFTAKLENDGVPFAQKASNGMAFALDPDGYWVEIHQRATIVDRAPNFHHAMLRVRNINKSLEFYDKICGLVHVATFQYPLYKSYFVAEESSTMPDNVYSYSGQLLELAVENDDTDQNYTSGNEEPRGFGHIALMVDDVQSACDEMETCGVTFKKRPSEGKMKGLAFILDPDGYWIEIVKRGIE
jgi:lactoylglutathione lyase